MFLTQVYTQNDLNGGLVALMVFGCIFIFALTILIITYIFVNLSKLSKSEKTNNIRDIIKELNDNEKKS